MQLDMCYHPEAILKSFFVCGTSSFMLNGGNAVVCKHCV